MVAASLHPLIVPITCAILSALFAVQRSGTARIGSAFGPVMAVWFVAIAVSGIVSLWRSPEVLAAVNPQWAVRFMSEHGSGGFSLLGSVVLVITGAEALYADLGHFGRAPIRAAWLAVALPALLLNYFGQGAALLRDPRVAGQIYVPEVNGALLVACLWLALEFGGSSALAAAYGVSVTGTMITTSLLFAWVAHARFGWSLGLTALVLAVFLAIDVSFFAANLAKILHGGWLPLAIGAVVFAIMTTWRAGRSALASAREMRSLPLDAFLADVRATRPHRVPGTAVVMSGTPEGVPVVLLHHFEHNRTLHERVVILSIRTDRQPRVHAPDRVRVADAGEGFFQPNARVGFIQDPEVPALLRDARAFGLDVDPGQASYFLGRESLLTTAAESRGRAGRSGRALTAPSEAEPSVPAACAP